MNHTGKVALVTGAASGIGAAIALRLASDGADLILGDISDAIQLQAKEIISKTGRNVVWGKVDVGDFASCSNFIESSMKNLGSKSVDILVNNAGINRDALFLKMTYEQWDSVIKVDLYSMFNMTKQLAQAMVDKGYGRIINISSMSWLGNIGQANYAAAKAGVIGFTKTLARELAKYNITVNAICPGFIDTPMTRAVPEKIRSIMLEKIPMKRIGDPKDVAALVSFLASEDASYITGEVINVSGGLVI
jgi:3-oxoacyl-[acyl-carrier protein] reductase